MRKLQEITYGNADLWSVDAAYSDWSWNPWCSGSNGEIGSEVTRAAIDEASRDGADRIDLIDGDALADMLKALRLGVTVKLVEQVDIDTQWFEGI